MASIQGLYGREILDSRGLPTVECTLWLDTGAVVVTSVPSGTSKGKNEALELRDNDSNWMWGHGVTQAVNNLNTVIAPALIGKDPTQQEEIDQLLISLDGTPNKSKLGANSLLAASQAVLKAAAASVNQPLYYYIQQKYQLAATLDMPSCIYCLINGGEHGADNLDIQEFHIIPASHTDYPTSLNMAVLLFHNLEEVLIAKGAIHSVGLQGGFAPNLYNNTDAFEILIETIKTSPYTFAQDLFFGVDIAASGLFQAGKYHLKDKTQAYNTQELIEYYKSMRNLYRVFYIEDPFEDNDEAGWEALTSEMGETTLIVGDDLLVTNKAKTQHAIDKKLCNAILIKPNQVGTITETIDVTKLAREAGWQIVISHRSGETGDDFIADFAVGVGAEYVKFGPANRGERVAKYNRLLQINAELAQMNQPSANV
ncbi:MAG TPA: phosphopyruvate hydratase [Vitreimonas sp.]|nr:phosphopyruvate hydratase [Vitreimonas sp.]